MDLLSGMPKGILHNILARLPDKDAAKTIVLSKMWRDTWYSFPNISVCNEYFFTKDDVPVGNNLKFSKLDNLIDYVTKRLLRLRDQGLAIKEFKLILEDLVDPTLVSHHLDQWIQMASESGVKVLKLYLRANEGKWYDLPLCVIEAKSLTKLELGEIRIGQEFLKHSMKLPYVKKLSLRRVLFAHEEVIEHLFSHFPLTKYLTVDNCYVYHHLSVGDPLESLFLRGLQKLKRVDLIGIQQVHIDSPNLKKLTYAPLNFNAPFKLNFDSCTTLRYLRLINLQSTPIVDKWFLQLFSKYPFLERLTIFGCSMSERINILSAKLKVLELICCSNLKEVNVDAPNMLSFHYGGDDKPNISFIRSSNLLEVRVKTIVDHQHFYSLKEFIWNIPQNILESLSLCVGRSFRKDNYPNLPELQVSSIPPIIKHLEVRVYSRTNNEALYGTLLNYLLSSCFPKTISFRYGSRGSFIEFFHDMLMGSKKGECHCSSSDTKCWWHALKIVSISCSFITNQNFDFKAMLDVWPESLDAETTFSLEL